MTCSSCATLRARIAELEAENAELLASWAFEHPQDTSTGKLASITDIAPSDAVPGMRCEVVFGEVKR